MTRAPPRELLIVNPNASARVTEWLEAEARRLAGDAWRVVAVNADSGLAAIQTPEELRQASASVVAALRARAGAGGAIIAAFGDPGLQAAQTLRLPVVGLGASGIQAASARRFSILTLGVAMEPSISAKVAELGAADRLASLRFLPFDIATFIGDREAAGSAVEAEARACFERDGAEVVLLGGAPFAGMARPLRLALGRDVLDGMEASLTRLAAVLGD